MIPTDITPPIKIPVALVMPVKLRKDAHPSQVGIFLPHSDPSMLCLALDWDGQTHLVRMAGPQQYRQAPIQIGSPISGALITAFDYRVDIGSRFNATTRYDRLGALVLKSGTLYLCCGPLGESYSDETVLIPLRSGFEAGTADEACGFTRWSVTILDGSNISAIRSFEALPEPE